MSSMSIEAKIEPVAKPTRFYRSVEVRHKGEWVSSSFSQLRPGMTFRMFEADGKPVTHEGYTAFRVDSEPDAVPGDLINQQVFCTPITLMTTTPT